jgi:sRNA-binding carbon storage regulator CsrA
MLVLSRDVQEAIVLQAPGWGYAIEISVEAIRVCVAGGDPAAVLGFVAPREVEIWRKEKGPLTRRKQFLFEGKTKCE